MRVELVYAQVDSVWRLSLRVPAHSTVGQAVQASGFMARFPDYPGTTPQVGVYGQLCALDRVLQEGERVEIYRPLNFDPMESRRRRALHRKAHMTKRLSGN